MRIALGLALISPFLSGCFGSGQVADLRRSQTRQIVQNWPPFARMTAAVIIEKYGPPDRAEVGRLTWFGNGQWRRTEIRNSAAQADTIEQTVGYLVPDSKRGDLYLFSDRIKVSQNGTELSASCDNEEENFAAINLAVEIIAGYTDPSLARLRFARARDLRGSGKISPLAEGLRYPPAPGSDPRSLTQ